MGRNRWLAGLLLPLLLLALPGAGGLSASAQIILTEFVADNGLGLKDEDGDYEDWLELHNSGSARTSLAGWTLTDDVRRPRQWELPAVSLAPGEFLVVFASGKNRRIPGRPLHTSFRLAAGGEYLALRRPDGSVATEFAPAYPPQAPDVSYGFSAAPVPMDWLGAGSAGRYWVPTDDRLGNRWFLPAYDDTGWSPMEVGVGWDSAGAGGGIGLPDLEPETLEGLLRTDLAEAMRGRNASVYLRLPFVVAHPAAALAPELRVRYDDGFVAYLNGRVVAQRNAPVASPGGVLADHAEDWSETGEVGARGWYYGYYDRGGDADGHYDPVTDFTNLDPEWHWTGSAWALGSGDPPWTFIARDSWHPDGGADGGGERWAIRRWVSSAAGPVRVWLSGAKQDTACGNGVTFRLLVNGDERFTRVVAADDAAGFAAEWVLADLAEGDLVDFVLEPAGTDGHAHDGCDGSSFAARLVQDPSEGPGWNSSATVSREGTDVRQREIIPLDPWRDLLRAGTNHLAIHLMNVRADDDDLLMLPELGAWESRFGSGALAYFAEPTPGRLNGMGADSLGPVIEEVRATPGVPGDDDDVVVTARVRPTVRPVAGVTLLYRVMFAAEEQVSMADDGQHGDGAAGDGVWGAWIPATASAPGQMVRWAVTATDTAGASLRFPAYPDPQRSPRYHGTVVKDPALAESRLPVLHWFLANPPAAQGSVGTRGAVFYEGEFYDNVGANVHGETTRGFPKNSFDLDFNPGANFRWRQDQPRVDDLNLMTTWADKTHLRNVLAYETYAQAGVPAHFAFPVRVQLNGRFHSVANLVENGDENFLERLGIDRQGAFYKMYNAAENSVLSEKKTRKGERATDLDDLIRALGQAGVAREAAMFDQLDVPQVVNFLAARAITADADCCHKNYYLYRDTNGTGEWSAFPWDVDLSFGRVWTCGTPCMVYFDETIYTNTGLFVGANNRIFSVVLNTPSTRQMYLRRVRTLMDQLTQPPGVAPEDDRWLRRTLELRDRIAPDAALDLAKWGSWGRRETITQAVDRIHQEFLPGRRQFLFVDRVQAGVLPESQPAHPEIRFAGFEIRAASGQPGQDHLVLTNPNPYAVDMTDWRVEGPVRFVFKPGTVIPAGTIAHLSPDRRAFRARAVSPRGGERRLVLGDYEGELSGRGGTLRLRDPAGRLVDESELPQDPSPTQRFLRIVEIHPNPAAVGVAIADEEEFLELANLGPDPLDLSGVRLTRGVTFDFGSAAAKVLPPGGRVVVVSNLGRFVARHGSGPWLAGVYQGNLEDAGERLRLEDAAGEMILDFSYSTAHVPTGDGLGFSLVIPGEALEPEAWNDPRRWRAGRVAGGTPGREEPDEGTVGVVVNEVLTHTDPPWLDAVELHNPGPTPASVGGWWLSDDPGDPFKFRIPEGTLVPPHGFLVFDEDDFNAPTVGTRRFAFSSLGDEVWLFAADAEGQLTGYADGGSFEAAANGVSFGRHTNRVGVVRFAPQREVTLGAPNAGPRVGPVIFNEICFAPARGEAPFVELWNLTASPVPLFDPAEPSHTWRIDGLDFDFPAGQVLAPGGLLLIVGGDPIDFRERHAIHPDIPVLGPWRGTLRSAGERLALQRPDSPRIMPDGSLRIPFVTVESVEFLAADPWPPLAGVLGQSLERIAAGSDGDDPAHWTASRSGPTPGSGIGVNRGPEVRIGPDQRLVAARFPVSAPLAAVATDDGLPADPGRLAVHWTVGGAPADATVVFEDPTQTNTLAWLPGPGTYRLQLRVSDGLVSREAGMTVEVSRPLPTDNVTFLSAGSRWRFFDLGRQPSLDWMTRAFEDSDWSVGDAPLGYGDNHLRTLLRSAVNGAILRTAYFRHAFVPPDTWKLRNLTLRLRRDDGAVVWLNGREVFRTNLPEGPVTYETLALSAVDGANETAFLTAPLAVGGLVEGTNVIAVEVHQQSLLSSDLGFDLALDGRLEGDNQLPFVEAGPDLGARAGDVVRLSGTWEDDGLPRPARIAWRQLSGPAEVTWPGVAVARPLVTLPRVGTYEFQFEVFDGEYLATDRVRVVAAAIEDPYLAWKTTHFTESELGEARVSGDAADPDEDGQTNLNEYRSGTLPRDSRSVLRLEVNPGSGPEVLLGIPVVPGRSYVVLASDNGLEGKWVTLEILEAGSDTDWVTVTDARPPSAGGFRFYRVVTPAPPGAF